MDKCVLVVDDDQDILQVLSDRLNFLGFKVITAGNGLEGLGLLKSQSVNGVLLDLQMPVMDGLAMLPQLQDQHPHLPIIVMSADGNKKGLLWSIENGASDYLTKPLDVTILAEKCLKNFT